MDPVAEHRRALFESRRDQPQGHLQRGQQPGQDRGWSGSEKETLWLTVNGYKYSDTFTIPSGGTDSFGVHTGAGYACEGIDTVTFYCWQY